MSPVSRRLLSRVRDVMAGSGAAQQQLDEIVLIIAADMVAEVCSVYVMRAGEVLELFGTKGLNASAVHNTRLRVGEGLIGLIAAQARPFALADAQTHSDFVFRPETGEELYHSLMGVPILRGGRVVGVIAVQNRTRRNYSDEEVEILQTVAMVLAELVGGGDLISRDELMPADGNALLPLRLEGITLNPGLGVGVAVLHEPQFHISQMVAEDVDHEHQRLRNAVSEMHGALDDMMEHSDLAGAGEHREILESYRMIAEDAGWFARIDEAVSSGLTAEAAVQKVHNDIRAKMNQVTDPYLRERVHDLEDLGTRLLQHLVGANGSNGAMPDDETVKNADSVILIARNMGPAQLLDYDRSKLDGLVLEEGSATAHVSIVARALDIPVVGQARGVLDMIETGEPVIVDGTNAQVFVRPGEEVRQRFKNSARVRAERKASYAQLRDLESVTRDGVRINLNINAGLLIDLPHLHDMGADGVGLYRTEVPFMVRSDFPGVDDQRNIYAKVLEQTDGKPVVFRTLDVGGDKILPYWDAQDEENPAMGWRAIRISFDRPMLLRQQLRALIQAASGRDLSVMFPMIAEVPEFDQARALLDLELEREKEHGAEMPTSISAGVMLEVPSLLFQLPSLLERVDFISVGSNDLYQFLFAADRGNSRLSERYDMLSPPVMSLLQDVVFRCNEAQVPLSLCGEMAASPLDAMALIGIGFRNISMQPNAIGPVKAMIRSLEVEPLSQYMDTLYNLSQHSLRGNLRAFAKDHGITV
ncbi:MAG: phosphoenolpyruvate--protein phosphotransferase [Rhodospirillaceae bacterium]|nr:phosphoenolpyruvate--protein phosphotransferase [Rhodospirillaceae bacterium]MBT5244001.1 phosphoenolpyruvate--protein phosphotransferase [Rhodospirillaceae bacterium]MBT5560821.1 phosphoenolpyruvate--protein phosphotransferase [Rhodospirillaceae bacterium]MBT6240559.1 phosphoenolpyruvate--protein phosphotransferase [Rhodospirillaceae bacterium]MBT7138371.1 phosphoenolpyruvate--protein phosphotransferase [Rhodospirillaceae bacterium]